MSKQQLEETYNIIIELKDNVFYVYKQENPRDKILQFLAPDLNSIDKSMKYKQKNGI